MCVVSMVGDFYRDKWQPQPWYPQVYPGTANPDATITIVQSDPALRVDLDALRKEVLEMKELLTRAKAYDEKNNEPDCEMDEKMALLRAVAKMVGVDLDDVLASKPKRISRAAKRKKEEF